MGARNPVGIGFSYRISSLESILGLLGVDILPVYFRLCERGTGSVRVRSFLEICVELEQAEVREGHLRQVVAAST